MFGSCRLLVGLLWVALRNEQPEVKLLLVSFHPIE